DPVLRPRRRSPRDARWPRGRPGRRAGRPALKDFCHRGHRGLREKKREKDIFSFEILILLFLSEPSVSSVAKESVCLRGWWKPWAGSSGWPRRGQAGA